ILRPSHATSLKARSPNKLRWGSGCFPRAHLHPITLMQPATRSRDRPVHPGIGVKRLNHQDARTPEFESRASSNKRKDLAVIESHVVVKLNKNDCVAGFR